MGKNKKLIANNMINPLIISFAINAHFKTNHFYDTDTPYSVHLAIASSYAQKYLYLLPKEEHDIAVSACWLHDVIEDTRNTYNDIKKISGDKVADIVYAVTNEKGKNRKERANEKYYSEIRQNKLAVYVKLCDRLANAHYSLCYNSKMHEMYSKENNQFIKLLFPKGIYFNDMVQELKFLLKKKKSHII